MDDYISREAAIAEIMGQPPDAHYPSWYAEQIRKLPAADMKSVVRGKWEEVEVTWLSDVEDQLDAIASMFCPKCKRFANHVYHYGDPTHGMNYCPNCGADMREETAQ
jgi:hypothetical protein